MAYIKDGMYCSDEKKEDFCIDRDRGYKEKECYCFEPKHPKPKGILLECGFHPQDAIFETEDCGHCKREQYFVLDKVLVDTTCLFQPQIKVEFSSLVVFEAEGRGFCEQEIEVELLFELERICNGHKELVQTWKYKKEIEVKAEKLELEVSTPFTVTFCDKACPGCCEYKMIVKGKKFEGCFDTLKVIKPNLSVLAQGQCCD